MRLVMKRFGVYARLTAIIALAMVIGLVILQNRNNTVTVWFFATYDSINVLWLMLVTAVASVVSWWMLTASLGLWRDMRALHQADILAEQERERSEREQKLKETEDRIDRKLSEAVKRDEIV